MRCAFESCRGSGCCSVDRPGDAHDENVHFAYFRCFATAKNNKIRYIYYEGEGPARPGAARGAEREGDSTSNSEAGGGPPSKSVKFPSNFRQISVKFRQILRGPSVKFRQIRQIRQIPDPARALRQIPDPARPPGLMHAQSLSNFT